MKYRIYTLGSLPWITNAIRVGIAQKGTQTLLDADAVVVNTPEIQSLWKEGSYEPVGHYRIGFQKGANELVEQLARWRRELDLVVRSGRVVVFLLAPFVECRCLLQTEGGNTEETVDNYSWLPSTLRPFTHAITAAEGDRVRLAKGSSPFIRCLRSYQQDFSYRCYLEVPDEVVPLAFNSSGKVVGFTLGTATDRVVALPCPSDAARERVGGAIEKAIVSVLKGGVPTPPPKWLTEYSVPGQAKLESQVVEAKKQVDIATATLAGASEELEEAKAPLALLFEQGTTLENAVRRVFADFGFDVTHSSFGLGDHDAIIEADGRVGVVEMEGRDAKQIDFDKVRQLNGNVDEYFAKKHVAARGFLVGLAHRLEAPDKRESTFTEHAVNFAKMKGFMLIDAVRLFQAYCVVVEANKPEDLIRGMREHMFDATQLHFDPPNA